MSLYDDMTEDLHDIIGADDLAVDAQLHAYGLDAADAQPLRLIPGDMGLDMQPLPLGMVEAGAQRFAAARGDVRAAIAAQIGVERDAARNDAIIFPDPRNPLHGRWVIQHAEQDHGGQTMLVCIRSNQVSGQAEGGRR